MQPQQKLIAILVLLNLTLKLLYFFACTYVQCAKHCKVLRVHLRQESQGMAISKP